MSFRSTLYVGNVAYSSNEEDLTQLFSQYGNVLSTEIKRGFAFVKFDTIEAAQSAAQGLDNHLFNGRNLKVNFSKSEPHPSRSSFSPLSNQINNVNSQPIQPQRVPYKENSIHVGNLPPQITEEELRQEFEAYGILAIHIINARNCFAIIELSSAENTAKVLTEVRGLKIEGREVAISKQLQLPERNNFPFRGRGFRGRGRGRGYYRYNYQRNTPQTFVLHNNLHNNNQNNNIHDVDNGNHINNTQIQNSFEDSQGNRFPKYHNNYRGNIFGVRRGYGRGRGGYRGRGSYRARGRGSFQSRGDNVLFSIPNPSS